MSATHFVVHNDSDTVGVVVVEDVKHGMELTGWKMESDETITVNALNDIPLGHKVALADFKDGDAVLKYGHDIGKIVQDVAIGGHVHTHNLKTKKW
ncbi:MAG: (2R)-sulfolactate sulfo-lyase subunit alpha [Alphaproteobacteria bacterium MarineAlpha4_Bin2]|mgnify:FL=1|nr:MAG: (2R)-sulfolactate sulfo-lyase subunit alpha [Alphaproteobacteria bacterium MarineAlpha4_Bin2]|tara:strand:+ start:443 stop:730 length:288 start_codon:yes stop_codon:yes gene_type:complete